MLVFFCTNVSISIFVALDTLMLGFLSSYEQVGLYTSPQKVLFALTAAIGAINFALVPRMSFNKKQNNNTTNALLLQKAFDLNVLLLVPMVTGLCLIASRFVPLFFGNEFMRSIVPMQILSVRVFISLINSLFAWNILMALGYENKFLMIVIATGILSVTLNWILIPHYGATGAAVTSLAAECFEMPLVLFIVHKFTEVRVKWRKMFVSILFTLPLFALYALVNNLISNNIAFLCTFIAIAIASYFSLQLVVRNYLVMQIINLCINKLKK
jgi:O-antigen/teichoic acid export membrane protein